MDKGSRILYLSDKGIDSDYFIEMPEMIVEASPVTYILPLQLLAYYVSLEKNLNPDKPRNLTKVVKLD